MGHTQPSKDVPPGWWFRLAVWRFSFRSTRSASRSKLLVNMSGLSWMTWAPPSLLLCRSSSASLAALLLCRRCTRSFRFMNGIFEGSGRTVTPRVSVWVCVCLAGEGGGGGGFSESNGLVCLNALSATKTSAAALDQQLVLLVTKGCLLLPDSNCNPC